MNRTQVTGQLLARAQDSESEESSSVSLIGVVHSQHVELDEANFDKTSSELMEPNVRVKDYVAADHKYLSSNFLANGNIDASTKTMPSFS